MAKSPRKSRAALYVIDRRAGGAIKDSLQGILTQFAKDFQDQVLRSATRAGALVFLDEMRLRAPVGEPNDSIKPDYQPGTLKNSIYHYHDKNKSVNGRQVYAVGPNKRKANHWFFAEYGHYIVNVTWRVPNTPSGQIWASKERLPQKVEWRPANPYIRPTWDSKKDDAIRAMQARMQERLKEIMMGNV